MSTAARTAGTSRADRFSLASTRLVSHRRPTRIAIPPCRLSDSYLRLDRLRGELAAVQGKGSRIARACR